MDCFRYVEVHKNEKDLVRESLLEGFYIMQENDPQMLEGIIDLLKSGVLEEPSVQEKTREMFKSWGNQIEQ